MAQRTPDVPVSGVAPPPASPLPAASEKEKLSVIEDMTDKLASAVLQGPPLESEHEISAAPGPGAEPGAAAKAGEQFQVIVQEKASSSPKQEEEVMAVVQEKAKGMTPAKIQAIKDLAENKTGLLSTQDILSRIMKEIKESGSGYRAEIETEFKGSPKHEVEAFSVPSAPGETFYKLGVTYKIHVQKDGKKVDTFPELEIKRVIHTTSKTPEGAIFAANDFKETVVNLALASVGEKCSARFEEFSKLDDMGKKEVMNQRSFKFNYSYGSDGKPSHLLSIFATDNEKKPIDLKVKADPEASKYIYYRDMNTQELRRISKDDTESYAGQAIYGSEEEALLHTPYVLKDEKPYERFDKSKTFQQDLDAIKADIKKREIEMAKIKETFIQTPSVLKFFSSPSVTEEFKQFLANLKYIQKKTLPDEELTPALRKLIQLEKLLEEKKGDRKILDEQHKQLLVLDGDMAKNPLVKIDDDLQELMKEIANQNEDDPFFQKKPPPTDQERLKKCIEIKEIELQQFTELEEQIAKGKKEIDSKVREFNNDFVHFQSHHQALERNLELLEKIKMGAADKTRDPAATQESQEKAGMILQLISDKEIAELQAVIKANQQFIADMSDAFV